MSTSTAGRGKRDLVERLRKGLCVSGCGTPQLCICTAAEEAADEITRLRTAVLALLPYAKAYAADFQAGLSPTGRVIAATRIAQAEAALALAEGR